MPEDILLVRWIGQQAVVTLPRHIDSSNAGQIREQLLRVVNSGAAVLIADLAATVSCDYSGAEAVVRAYRRAVESGTGLRLVVATDVVRRAFTVNGLHRLIPMYLTLDAALAAVCDTSELPGGPGAAILSAVPRPRAADPQSAADPDDGTGLLDQAINHIFSAAMNLQDVPDLPREAIAQRVTDSLGRLDDAVREIRDYTFAGQGRVSQPEPARWHPPDIRERAAAAVKNTAFLRQCLVERAHALHAAAVDIAALLERRSDILGEPTPIDYPTDIKRWRLIADQAEEMTKRWEQRSLPQFSHVAHRGARV